MCRMSCGCGQEKGAVPFTEQTTKDGGGNCSRKGGSDEEASGRRTGGSRGRRRTLVADGAQSGSGSARPQHGDRHGAFAAPVELDEEHPLPAPEVDAAAADAERDRRG